MASPPTRSVGTGRLADKVAVVTGAGAGIGRASAIRFGREGAAVLVTSRSLDNAEATAAAIRAEGGRAESLAVDVNDLARVEAMVEVAIARFGRIDVLFNNAIGVDFDAAARDVDFLKFDPAIFVQTMQSNVLSGLVATRTALPQMLQQGSGSILFTSSVAGLEGDISQFAYGGSKATVNWYVKSIAASFGKRGIRCNAIVPGVIKTASQDAWATPESDAAYLHATNWPRLGTAEDVAGLALFLASDEAQYVNGALYTIDGGASCTTGYTPSLRTYLRKE
jgi:NAD(P)-dependent dehydrogenase (short-subunit alcohol dehydrogenase family)